MTWQTGPIALFLGVALVSCGSTQGDEPERATSQAEVEPEQAPVESSVDGDSQSPANDPSETPAPSRLEPPYASPEEAHLAKLFKSLEPVTMELNKTGALTKATAELGPEYGHISALSALKIAGSSEEIGTQIGQGAGMAAEISQSCDAIAQGHQSDKTVACRFWSGYAHELLAKAMFVSEYPTDTLAKITGALPADLREELERLPAADRDGMLGEQITLINLQWRADMVHRVEELEAQASAQYQQSVDAAPAKNVQNDHALRASQRVAAIEGQ